MSADPIFVEKLRAQFEGEPGKDYKLNFWLAPPSLTKGEQGQPKKKRFGPSMMPTFKVLAKLKRLRGTAFDPFGRTEERRAERRLIEDYFGLVNEFANSLTAGRLGIAIELASLPDDIRGYGHVKEAAIVKTEARRSELMNVYKAGGATAVPSSKAIGTA